MKSLMRHVVLLALLALALVPLSACDTSPAITPVAPNNPLRATATTALQPTGTVGALPGTPITPITPIAPALPGIATVKPLIPEPPATGVPVSTASSTPAGGNIIYKHYNAGLGGWSIDYPQSWQTSVISPNVQFLDLTGNALIQVTYGELAQQYDPEELVQLASANMQKDFGDTYVQKSQAQQADGSTRIDFAVAGASATFNGQTIVGQRGTGLYILMLLDKAGTEVAYQPVFDHALQSYSLPAR